MEGIELLNPNDPRNVLGVGSFARVHLGRVIASNQLVAIKIIDKSARCSPIDLENMVKEVAIHSNLQHPNIIRLLSHRDSMHQLLLALEYAPRGTLFSYLNEKRMLSEGEAIRFFVQCTHGIKYLQSMNIVHRDFKPENVLLDSNLVVKICDFGWATDLKYETLFPFCGTYEYMAPEMIERRRYDHTLDNWGLGILLYELLHGFSPFRAVTPHQIMENIRRGNISMGQHIKGDVRDLLLRILRSSPRERLSCAEMLSHPCVQRVLTPLLPPPPPPPPMKATRSASMNILPPAQLETDRSQNGPIPIHQRPFYHQNVQQREYTPQRQRSPERSGNTTKPREQIRPPEGRPPIGDPRGRTRNHRRNDSDLVTTVSAHQMIETSLNIGLEPRSSDDNGSLDERKPADNVRNFNSFLHHHIGSHIERHRRPKKYNIPSDMTNREINNDKRCITLDTAEKDFGKGVNFFTLNSNLSVIKRQRAVEKESDQKPMESERPRGRPVTGRSEDKENIYNIPYDNIPRPPRVREKKPLFELPKPIFAGQNGIV